VAARGRARRRWRLLNSGLRIRRRWCFDSAVHVTAERAGSRAKMLVTTSSQKLAPDAPSVSALCLFLGAGPPGGDFSRSSTILSSPATFSMILSRIRGFSRTWIDSCAGAYAMDM
jgi:hypothetical protein